MVELQQRVAQLTARPEWRQEFRRGTSPIYSYDNDPIHLTQLAKLQLKIPDDCKYPLPPNSPDLHRVVEHVMAHLKGAMRQHMHSATGKRPVEEAKAQLLRVFEGLKAESIASDVKGLPLLYRAIISLRGGWPPKPLR